MQELLTQWMAVMPTRAAFTHNMPLLWPKHLQELLPEGARKIFEKQKIKHDRDIAILDRGFLDKMLQNDCEKRTLDELRALYTHAWLLVNSRCFFYDIPAPAADGRALRGKRKRKDRDDCMAMCPVLDCFNHSDEEDVCNVYRYYGNTVLMLVQCEVSYDKDGFSVKCLRDIGE